MSAHLCVHASPVHVRLDYRLADNGLAARQDGLPCKVEVLLGIIRVIALVAAIWPRLVHAPEGKRPAPLVSDTGVGPIEVAEVRAALQLEVKQHQFGDLWR